MHGLFEVGHHFPNFIPVKDTILIFIELIELVLDGELLTEVDSLNGFKNKEGELLELVDSQLLILVLISGLEHLSDHVLELFVAHVRGSEPLASDDTS
jgi:hypothetical protein